MDVKLILAKLLLRLQHKFLGIVAFSFTREVIDQSPKRILLIRTSALGDFIFAIPAMVELRRRYPKALIYLLTAASTNKSQLMLVEKYAGKNSLPWLSFAIPSLIDDVIAISSIGDISTWNGYRRLVSDFGPDFAIILAHPGERGFGLLKKIVFLRCMGMKGIIYGWRTRASNGWLKHAQYSAGLFDHHVIGPIRSICELPNMPNVDENTINFPLSLDAVARPWVASLWNKYNWDDECVVAVAPGSVHDHKRWPLVRFIELCNQLATNFNIRLILIGTKSDIYLAQQLTEMLSVPVVNVVGETTLSQSAAILERCGLLVGNDGGAMHLGSAMRCPVVAIVPGLEFQNSIEPWFSRDYAVRHDVSCSPCYSFTHCPKGHNKCMQELPLSAVYEKCSQILKKRLVVE